MVTNKYFNKSLTINVLEKPNKNSNISSQIIYGEDFKILSKNKNFYKVKNLYDNYIGFISKKVQLSKKFNPTYKIKSLKSKIYIGSENNKKKPISYYWLTKLKAENYIIKKFQTAKINYCIGRIFSTTNKNQKKNYLVPDLKFKIRKSKKKTYSKKSKSLSWFYINGGYFKNNIYFIEKKF